MFYFNICGEGSTRVQTQGFTLGRQALYHLSHIASHVLFQNYHFITANHILVFWLSPIKKKRIPLYLICYTNINFLKGVVILLVQMAKIFNLLNLVFSSVKW
jgi:hypothetical protein